MSKKKSRDLEKLCVPHIPNLIKVVARICAVEHCTYAKQTKKKKTHGILKCSEQVSSKPKTNLCKHFCKIYIFLNHRDFFEETEYQNLTRSSKSFGIVIKKLVKNLSITNSHVTHVLYRNLPDSLRMFTNYKLPQFKQLMTNGKEG